LEAKLNPTYHYNTAVCVFSKGFLGCLGRNPPPGYEFFNTLTGGLGRGHYEPSGKPSDYGRDASSADDFANAFVYYVLMVNNLEAPGNIPYDEVRVHIITKLIDTYTR
jgi:hypothetical protein